MSNKAPLIDCVVVGGKFREYDGTMRKKGDKVKLTVNQCEKYKDCIVPETQLKTPAGNQANIEAIKTAAKAEGKKEALAEFNAQQADAEATAAIEAAKGIPDEESDEDEDDDSEGDAE